MFVLSFFKQALIEKWLIEYKFKELKDHTTGLPLAYQAKAVRAQKIAKELGDNTKWFSHGRFINIDMLRNIGLEVDDYTDDHELSNAIRGYNDLLMAYIYRGNIPAFLNSRAYF